MVINQQNAIRVDPRALGRFLARVRRELRLNGHEVTVCLLDDRRMAGLNRRFRAKRGSTDVLSFPSRAVEVPVRRKSARTDGRAWTSATSPAPSYLGDIAISPHVARRNARRLGRTLDSELRVLILHGLLHLLGYDHESDDGRMERFERRLRRRLGLEAAKSARHGKP
jgi:probable rRNA maturation factor